MPAKITFAVQPRTISGKAVKRLRRERITPGNIVSPQGESVAVQFPEHDFAKTYEKVGETGLFYVTVQGEASDRPVLLEDVQMHPTLGNFTHVVFRQVNLKEKISAEVPVHLIGENKIAGAVVVKVVDAISVEALPADFPEAFEVDISTLTEVGQTVTYADLKFDSSKVKLEISEEEMATPVVMLDEVKEEPVEEVAAPAEGDATPGAEGAAPAGDAAPTEAAKSE